MCTDPKSVKIQLSCQCLFALWGSSSVKAAHKMLMKLIPACTRTRRYVDNLTSANGVFPSQRRPQVIHL